MTEPLAQTARRNNIIASISGWLGTEHFPPGERAALKRIDPGNPSPGAYAAAMRLLLDAGADAEVANTERLKRWMLLIHGMALMSGPKRAPHHSKGENAAGAVMFRNSYSEARLRRLLEARGVTFDGLLSRLARFLAAKNAIINWADLAPLILDRENGERAERARLNLMRDFLGAERRAERDGERDAA